ncbi:MAG: hypothetical protein JST76_13525 [Bacteroidetes bacterium]|nr:hypothetical protein [Bacteroidota bacterium]
MKTGDELYEDLLKAIEAKKGERINDDTIPFALLHHVANNLTSITVNGVKQFDVRSDYEILCHIYQKWKSDYEAFTTDYKDNPNVNINYGNVSVREMVRHKDKFEALFAEIDSLGVFKPVNF